jgi:PAB-dependent poly(A)-specific ribonuclease subunit 2
LPHYREKLLSAWPSHLIFEVGNPPQKIDPDILATMTSNESIGFAANYKKLRRNFTPNARVVEKANVPAKGPKFLSEKARGQDAAEATAKRISDAADVLGDITLADGFSPTGSSTKVPPYYQNVEIKYSRFGVDDFDFKFVLLEIWLM